MASPSVRDEPPALPAMGESLYTPAPAATRNRRESPGPHLHGHDDAPVWTSAEIQPPAPAHVYRISQIHLPRFSAKVIQPTRTPLHKRLDTVQLHAKNRGVRVSSPYRMMRKSRRALSGAIPAPDAHPMRLQEGQRTHIAQHETVGVGTTSSDGGWCRTVLSRVTPPTSSTRPEYPITGEEDGRCVIVKAPTVHPCGDRLVSVAPSVLHEAGEDALGVTADAENPRATKCASGIQIRSTALLLMRLP
ncbi:hypothetical protein DFH08DRAFT_946863 [Mycena albidolilacea]|uniref:Uncharacterized protein n=1 Tax=Mycena albidolilacea TaxID=1033008 RepID=A0AAD7ATP6_9AGAR|nr:hypothetical protein DFH08DRAFT_946863 [Mycena albidolilacea]